MSDVVWRLVTGWALGICWGLFGVVWLAGAAYNAWKGPATRTRSMGSYLWIVVPVAAVLTARAIPSVAMVWGHVGAWWVRVLGLVVLLAGTAFTLWTRGVLGTMWSSVAVVKEDHKLRTDGPYRFVRHPIYTGLLAMLLGTAFLNGLGVWVAIWLVAVVLLELKIYDEERLLRKTFPEEYERYRRSVPQLVPGVGWLMRR
jgi:protein-S-isoprenylcysteine O-methyltransferase Ste14